MHRIVRVATTLALVLAGSGGTAAVASSSPPTPVPVLPVYLALGDSMAAGQNSEAPEDIAAYWRTVDTWKRNGYVTPFAGYLQHELDCLPTTAEGSERCGQLEVINFARSAVPPDGDDPGLPGVTAQAVIDEQLEDAEDLIDARNGDDDPRNDVKIVTLTVGGNEIFDAFAAAGKTGDQTLITQAIGTFATDYTEILARLREAVGPDVPILTMTYFNPLRYCDTGLPPEQVEFVAAQADTVLTIFNGVIAAISGAVGAVPADTYGQLGEGDFFDCKHPNKAGYEHVVDAFETAWQQIDD